MGKRYEEYVVKKFKINKRGRKGRIIMKKENQIKKRIKRTISAALGLTFAFSLMGCGTGKTTENAAASVTQEESEVTVEKTNEEENTVLRVGANITPHSEILEQAVPLLAEKGITLEVVKIEDSVSPNTALVEGSLDANYFQHVPYLEQFNEENGTDLISVGAIHYEPFGIYAGKTKDLSELPEGAIVAVPNNVTNEARALLLLQQEGFLTLKEGAGINATVEDVVENPKNITFKELAPEQLVASLPDVDVAVINGNYAIEGGLHVNQALAVEASDGLAAETYGNVIATREDQADNEAIKTLVEVLQSEEISQFIQDTYDGAVVPLQ